MLTYVAVTMLRNPVPPEWSQRPSLNQRPSAKQQYSFPTRLGRLYYCCYEFNVICAETPRHTYHPLPSGGCPSAFLQTVTFPHAPRWPFTMPSESRNCSVHARDGHRTVVTSESSRLFTFGVFLHVRWWGKIPHVEICRRAGTTCLKKMPLRSRAVESEVKYPTFPKFPTPIS